MTVSASGCSVLLAVCSGAVTVLVYSLLLEAHRSARYRVRAFGQIRGGGESSRAVKSCVNNSVWRGDIDRGTLRWGRSRLQLVRGGMVYETIIRRLWCK